MRLVHVDDNTTDSACFLSQDCLFWGVKKKVQRDSTLPYTCARHLICLEVGKIACEGLGASYSLLQELYCNKVHFTFHNFTCAINQSGKR